MNKINREFYHHCVVHPLLTIWPRVGTVLHSLEETRPWSPCLALQVSAAVIDDEPVQRIVALLAENEPFGPLIPHRRTLIGILHNLVAHPLMYFVPAIGDYIHDAILPDNIFMQLAAAVRRRADRAEEVAFDALCDAVEAECAANDCDTGE